ncbi:hypothetical protein GPECTOR_36g60 [Gonium pectorale]|uniref:Uncharacterized protein n=1 Tax=Gonium pectorale TaxID=33097 RepID=A0A150GBV8_GONPE|nr:hypothetical protein GPECTOR_36g60 [Gonium pectorale]|eukprot:KXZ47336.1 hypothetical protein GPECTOR_36g60 [Gonium pectorale]
MTFRRTLTPTHPRTHDLAEQLWADPRLGIVLDPLFQDLRIKSCQGPVFFRNSMPGKVWRSGAVQIVQNLRILPPTLHPRSQLSEEALERMAEALYIPIYDLARPARGQVCVLEVLLSSRATEAMLVADVLSFVGNLLTALQLSLANPVQQPVRRSVLCGRRARAPDSDGEASGGEEGQAGAAGQRTATGAEQEAGTVAAAAGGRPRCSSGEGVREATCSSSQAATAAASAQPTAHSAGAEQVQTGAAAPEALGHSTVAGDGSVRICTAAGRDSRAQRRGGASGEDAAPTASEVPTLPASPSPERQRHQSSEPAAAAAGPSGSSMPSTSATAAAVGAVMTVGTAYCGSPGIPRKIRKVLEGAMQRSKSVAALSNGDPSDDEDGEGAGAGWQATAVAAGERAGTTQREQQAPQPSGRFLEGAAGGRGGPPLDPRPAAGGPGARG